ncbi:aminoglycoside phosphotransferase [Planctomycetales bacterium]|nr:aminoglycoside phosphotransferase [Planctomycetales bacterium]GHT08769.1 aminoglycoside phosphotransferase [Planctomycetales bacterium]GHV19606.1 aminoglycoside phosphotransferase [Planctomycetales bacterium]
MSNRQPLVTRHRKIIYRDGDKLIKQLNNSYSDTNVFNEAFNLACVRDSGIRSPQLLEVVKSDGQWALVLGYIEGETLSDLTLKNPDDFNKYLQQFVDIQLEMHKHSAPRLRSWHEKMHGKISASGLEKSIRFELHTRLDSLPRATDLCHGDFNPTNVIIDPHGDWHIIDWAHATRGHAAADAARTYLIFSLKGKEELAGRYLDCFCAAVGTSRQFVQRWMPIVAASQLVKAKPEEREMLSRWASVVEYN